MELELEHKAPYLPYDLKLLHDGKVYTMVAYDSMVHIPISAVDGDAIKLILRNLSDLTKEIEHNGERFVPIEDLSEMIDEAGMGYNDHYVSYHPDDTSHLTRNWIHEPYFIVEQLLEWHFDLFGLIENGVAVDINTLEA